MQNLTILITCPMCDKQIETTTGRSFVVDADVNYIGTGEYVAGDIVLWFDCPECDRMTRIAARDS